AAGVTGKDCETVTRLSALRQSGRVACIGAGRPGDPYLFAVIGTLIPDGFAGTVPSVPHRSPTVPGNAASSGGPTSVPSVPSPSMEGERGTDSDPARKEPGSSPRPKR